MLSRKINITVFTIYFFIPNIQPLFSQWLPIDGGGGGVTDASYPHNPIPKEDYDKIAKIESLRKTFAPNKFPMFIWPLTKNINEGNPFHDAMILINYVDQGGTKDYMNGAMTYNGHKGTDISQCTFQAMDKGLPIYAAAKGIVDAIEFSQPDRHTQWGQSGSNNKVIIYHMDGSYGFYYHFRKNSITVKVGETVLAGQMIGLMGSSGFSDVSHLHFECGQYNNNQWIRRDPWAGPNNSDGASLWSQQQDYVGFNDIHFFQIGVTTKTASNGSYTWLGNNGLAGIKEGPDQPFVTGVDEEDVCIWYVVQGNPNAAFTIQIVKPDGQIFGSYSGPLNGKYRISWWWRIWSFRNRVGINDYGTWKAVAKVNGILVAEQEFEVGAASIYKPRFEVGGKSFRIDGSIQTNNLTLTSFSPSSTYSLLNALDCVTLDDAKITINGHCDQPYRSYYFQALATSTGGSQDTMWYHLVDPTKPPIESVPTVVQANEHSQPNSIFLYPNYPNPFNSSTSIRYQVANNLHVKIAVFDILGRKVITLIDEKQNAGTYSIQWNGLNKNGFPVNSGVYIINMIGESFAKSRKILLIQ